jgi:hypothetical protein
MKKIVLAFIALFMLTSCSLFRDTKHDHVYKTSEVIKAAGVSQTTTLPSLDNLKLSVMKKPYAVLTNTAKLTQTTISNPVSTLGEDALYDAINNYVVPKITVSLPSTITKNKPKLDDYDLDDLKDAKDKQKALAQYKKDLASYNQDVTDYKATVAWYNIVKHYNLTLSAKDVNLKSLDEDNRDEIFNSDFSKLSERTQDKAYDLLQNKTLKKILSTATFYK